MVTWHGWAGKILDVDLSTGVIKKEPLSKEWGIKYVGGSGFMARILYDEVGPEVNALEPENISVIGHGPLCGTIAPSSGRYEVAAKSPVTGIYGRSNGGGNFGPEMKWAGYDLIIIRGRADKPVYLWIEDDHVELRDAHHLWGQVISVSRRLICDELGDADVATLMIGPAGENGCLSSGIISDLARAAGKNGIGAVWGSKKLKGIAVRGTKGTSVAKPNELLQISKALCERLKEDPLYETHTTYGTMGWVGGCNSRQLAAKVYMGGSGSKNIEESAFDSLIEKNLACFGCPLHCSHFLRVSEGRYKGTKGEGLEGAVQCWGIGMRAFSAPFLVRYNALCNELGLNVDLPAVAINWAMHLWETGIITKEDTDGFELIWGNEDAILELTKKIARKEGFGEVLDSYPIGATQKLQKDSHLYAAHNKGAYTYNVSPGIGTSLHMTLGLNVATRGFDHLTGSAPVCTPGMRDEWGITRELLTRLGRERYGDPNVFIDIWDPNPKKAHVIYDSENLNILTDMVGICKIPSLHGFIVAGFNTQDISQLLAAATGEAFAADDLSRAAERQLVLERSFNAREGIRRIDDYPFFLEWLLRYGKPNPVFNYAQIPVSLDSYDVVLDEYYRLRGCALKTGIPTKAKLEELGLTDVVQDLANRNLLME